MKKILCLLIALLTLTVTFTSCGKEDTPLYKDTLIFSNEEKTLVGAFTRYTEIINSLMLRVNTLETSHNNDIKTATPETYFNNTNYIFTMFDPFPDSVFDVIRKFDDELTNETAANAFFYECSGDSVYYSDEDGIRKLKFASDRLERTWKAEYDKGDNSFRIVYTESSNDGTSDLRFLEFVTLSQNTYAIQGNKAKCIVSFDNDGNISEFDCVTLKDNSFTLDDGIYGVKKKQLDDYGKKIAETDKSFYDKLYSYKDQLLTYNDMGTGALISVEISAEIYASAFMINA